MQLLMGMSMRRYFPAIGTAGFERILVNGCRREPRPPPIITPRTSFIDGIADLHDMECDRSSYCYYLLIFKSWRSFYTRNTKGYAKIISTSIKAKIRDSLINHLLEYIKDYTEPLYGCNEYEKTGFDSNPFICR